MKSNLSSSLNQGDKVPKSERCPASDLQITCARGTIKIECGSGISWTCNSSSVEGKDKMILSYSADQQHEKATVSFNSCSNVIVNNRPPEVASRSETRQHLSEPQCKCCYCISSFYNNIQKNDGKNTNKNSCFHQRCVVKNNSEI
uniref:Uncharacterized protein n=1 Tax=Proboscia inermis TaxID=420281 RepID=A0A7S0CA81_9STRA|mmetsp:Transcript_35206/g.35412  ORF Transcript_35206/g.35412 Transcript_35206/m.35412 type:complete len:145 (+) Transcript_35206:1-435(+)